MPFTLDPIAVTSGASFPVNIPGDLGTVSWVKFVNASPYLLRLTNLLGGSDYLQPGEANTWNVPGLTTPIQVTAQPFVTNPTSIPSSALVVTWYLSGERPSGSYPVNFNSLTYLGNTVTSTATTPNSLEQDILTPFVLSGLTAAKDATTPNRLDVASGIALIRQSDNSIGRVAPNASNVTTTQPSATYYLFLNPDGTYSFQLSNSGQANALTIATVTTDASGNISTVTDTRVTASTLLSGMAGVLTLPTVRQIIAQLALGGSTQTFLEMIATDKHTWAIQEDTAGDLTLNDVTTGNTWTFGQQGLSILPNAIFQINGQSTVGSFGLPLMVAQVVDYHMTTTALLTILSYAVATTGHYRLSASVTPQNATSPQAVSLVCHWTDPHTGVANAESFVTVNSGVVTPLAGGSSIPTTGGAAYPTMPLTVMAKAGTNLTVSYNDPGGTPNDYISVYIERIG